MNLFCKNEKRKFKQVDYNERTNIYLLILFIPDNRTDPYFTGNKYCMTEIF